MAPLPDDFRLLQVLPALDAGGVERTTLDMARAVIEAGGVSLVASAGGRLLAELLAGGSRHFELPLAGKSPLAMLANIPALEAIIRRERVSLVHVRSRAPAFSALPAARRAKVPIVSTYHGIYNARSGVKRWYNRIMTRTDLVIANSDYTRTHILAEHAVDPERVVAIPRGIDLERFSPGAVDPGRVAALRARLGLPDDGRPIVLLAGRLTRWKGQALLIEAAAELRRTGGGDVRLILAGDPQGRDGYVDGLQRLIEDKGFKGEVLIAGHLEDMPAAYLLADIAAAPSLEPEAFGRTAVEPQAMGRPVLAADHGATAETVEDGVTGLRLAPGSLAAWTAGLKQMVALGPEGRRRMGEAGRERVLRLYGLRTMQARTLEVYRRVLEAAP